MLYQDEENPNLTMDDGFVVIQNQPTIQKRNSRPNPFYTFFENLFFGSHCNSSDSNKSVLRSQNIRNKSNTTFKVSESLIKKQNSIGAEDSVRIPTMTPIELIKSTIDPKLLDKISELQTQAYSYDRTGIEQTECCICLEENLKLVPLICKHQLCVECHKKLIKAQFTTCPICRESLLPVVIHKLYAIMTLINLHSIGILYIPLIYDEKNDKWKDHDYFKYLNPTSTNVPMRQFAEIIHQLNNEKYVVILNNPKYLISWLEKCRMEPIKQMHIIKIN